MARFPEAKRRFLVAKLGEARVMRLEEYLPLWAKELEERGVEFKGTTDSPVGHYITDLVTPPRPDAKAIKQLNVVPRVGPYLADLATGRVEKGDS